MSKGVGKAGSPVTGYVMYPAGRRTSKDISLAQGWVTDR